MSLSALPCGTGFYESMRKISGAGGVLVEEDLNDAAGTIELQAVWMCVDKSVESLGGCVLGDHAESGWSGSRVNVEIQQKHAHSTHREGIFS